MSLADRHLSHRLAAKYGTGDRLGWQSAIGRILIKEMLSLLQVHDYKCVSLSVQKANYAAKLYQKIGFRIIKEIGDEWIMTYNL